MTQDLLTDWNIENLRFSLFLASPSQPVPVDSWSAVVGRDADDTRIKGTGDQRVVRQQGPFGDARMRADVRIDRIDWFLLPSPPAAPVPDARPMIGPYGAVTDKFRDTMLRWLNAAPLVANRMAFGAQLSRGTGTRPAALTVLAELLPTIQVDPSGTWDFDYTVNKRRTSEVVVDLMINRLAKWSLGKQILGSVELPVNGGEPKMRTTTSYLPVLTLDINTPPEFSGVLAPTDELVKELFALGAEIALQGDIP